MMSVTIRILLLLLCAGLSAHYTSAQGIKERAQEPSPPDALVDVGGGRRLHVTCSGVNSEGSPTVVLESGAGEPSSVWGRVQPEVAKLTRVCSYDRAGLGSSDPVPAPRTIVALTEDLHALLAGAKVPGPYVLVGHSLGGMLNRLYASYYPADVAGMVLVDSAHEDEADRGLALIPPETFKEMLKQLRPEDLIPQQSRERIDGCSIRSVMGALNWHGDIPLVVLTQGRPYGPDMVAVPSIAAEAYRLHLELQRDLARRSPRGKQVIAEKSSHSIHQDQPELVIEAIRQVIKEAKSGGRGVR
jgi:pimeloyl-ACP methyl ester carboxylesterase